MYLANQSIKFQEKNKEMMIQLPTSCTQVAHTFMVPALQNSAMARNTID